MSLDSNHHVMKNLFSRRNFLRSGVVAAATWASASTLPLSAELTRASSKPSPIHLGLASYSFRNFSRAQMIASMKQLNLSALNAKDVKDHLPMDPAEEAKALADYAAAGIQLHASGAIYFRNDEDADI